MERSSRLPLHIGNSQKRLTALIIVSLFVVVPLFSLHGISALSATSASLIAIDGTDYTNVHASGGIPTVSFATTSISTANSPDLILIVGAIFDNGSTVATPSPYDHAGLLHFRERTVGTISFPSYNAQLFEFWAISNTPLSSDKVNVTLTQPELGLSYKIFGISGYNTTSPFDPGLSVAPPHEGNNANPSVSVTTADPTDMIIGMAYIAGGPNVTPGNGFNCVGKANACGSFGTSPVAFAEYQVFSTAQTGVTVSASLTSSQTGNATREQWVMSADAVEGLPSPTTTTTSSFSSSSSSSTITLTSSSSSTTTSSTSQTTTTTSVISHGIPSTTTTSQSGSGGPISLTLAAIIAAVVVIGAIGASIFIRRRPTTTK
jgi:hypothetical protein